MDVYVVLTEDRHAETEAEVFAEQEEAVAYAEEVASGYDRSSLDPGDREGTLSASMIQDGWVRYLPCTDEGDCVRVVRRELQ